MRGAAILRPLAVIVLATACGSAGDVIGAPSAEGTPTTQVSSVPTASTPAGRTTEPGLRAEIEALLDPLAVARPADELTRAVTAMAATADASWVPYLIDLLRVEFEPAALDVIGDGLAVLTGIPRPTDQVEAYVTYGRWMLDRHIDAGPAYVPWKAHLYGQISDEFQTLITRFDAVTAARVQWGGVTLAGIPELNDPALAADPSSSYLTEAEVVFGANVNGETRAYPRRILDFHELANDVLGGVPVALANCTLCRSAILYDRRVDGETLDFVTSGLLLNSNKLMLDLQTRTVWEQLTGTAIAGPLAGTSLRPLFLTTTTWEDWHATHPDTTVIDIPARSVDPEVVGGYSYEPGDAYAEYNATAALWFPAESVGGGVDKLEILGVALDGRTLAVSADALAAMGPQVIPIGDGAVVAIPTAGGSGRLYLADRTDVDLADATPGDVSLRLGDGTELPRLDTTPAFWFAWAAAHPASILWDGR